MNKYISNFIALVWACVGISWVCSMWDVVLSVRLRTKTNESGMNKAGSPAIHTVPERHIIWHRTWSTHTSDLSLSLYTRTHTLLLIRATITFTSLWTPFTEGLSVPLTTKIGLWYTIWTISLLERLNIIVNGEGKSFWLRVKRLSTVTASVFLSELGGQSNQNGSGGDEKMDVPQSLALNLTTLYKKREGCDPPLHPSPPLSCPVCLLVSLP